MHPIIETIKSQGVPVHSVIRAGQYLGSNGIGVQPDSRYVGWIKEITGQDVSYENSDLLRMTYSYLISEALMTLEHTDVLNASELLEAAEGKASWLVTNSTWMFAKAEGDTEGNVTSKKGSKQEIAKEVYDTKIKDKGLSRKDAIALLVEAGASTSAAGASTVYAKLKKGEL